jgi:hypothetical protein
MGLYPAALESMVAAAVGGPFSNVVVLDPVNGLDTNSGNSLEKPVKTLAAAWAKVTDNQNDVIAIVGTATPVDVAAAFNWTKNYTHLIGLTANLPGVGQRARVRGTAAIHPVYVMTISGNGCIFKNINFQNESAADVANGAVVVTGSRNYFENCFISGMMDATPAARTDSYSLTLSGDAEENVFKRCSIGLQTVIRTAANAELIFGTGTQYRNKFIQCEFLSWSVTAGKLLVKYAAGSVPWVTQFEDCLFDNLDMSAGGADGASIDNAFGDSSTAKHQVILRGNSCFVGCTGVADTVTNIYSASPAPSAGFGLSGNPTT